MDTKHYAIFYVDSNAQVIDPITFEPLRFKTRKEAEIYIESAELVNCEIIAQF